MSTDWVPDACTLPSPQQPTRVAEFDDLLAEAVAAQRISSTRLAVTLPSEATDRTRELTDAESSCCAFFTFTIGEVTDDRFTLTVEVPPNQVAVLNAWQERAGA